MQKNHPIVLVGASPNVGKAPVHAHQLTEGDTASPPKLNEIIDSPNFIIVANSKHAGEVARIVRGIREARSYPSRRSVRGDSPWGSFEPIGAGPKYKNQLLYKSASAHLNLERHSHRSEYWVFFGEVMCVRIENDERLVREGESMYIAPSNWHQLENPSRLTLSLVALQIRPYVGEDDVVCQDGSI